MPLIEASLFVNSTIVVCENKVCHACVRLPGELLIFHGVPKIAEEPFEGIARLFRSLNRIFGKEIPPHFYILK